MRCLQAYVAISDLWGIKASAFWFALGAFSVRKRISDSWTNI
jgi:hypothetical protein